MNYEKMTGELGKFVSHDEILNVMQKEARDEDDACRRIHRLYKLGLDMKSPVLKPGDLLPLVQHLWDCLICEGKETYPG